MPTMIKLSIFAIVRSLLAPRVRNVLRPTLLSSPEGRHGALMILAVMVTVMAVAVQRETRCADAD